MLSSNFTLERLSIKENGIGNEGATALFTGLVPNRRLAHLNVDKNDLGLHNDPKLCELKNSVSSTRTIVVDVGGGKK